MKPHRIIITRDDSGMCAIWNIKTTGLVKSRCNPGGYDAPTNNVWADDEERFLAIFGFLPRKGSKGTYRVVPDEVKHG